VTPRLPTGTVTLLFVDMVGSTGLLDQLKERFVEVLSTYRDLLTDACRANGGQLVDTQGDALFFAFPRARAALVAAIDAQRALAARSWPSGLTVGARMGLHTGEPIGLDSAYVGMDVHRAARISAAGKGVQILLSQTSHDLVADDLPAGVTLRDLGEHRLKDMKRPQHLFQVVADGLPADVALMSVELAPTSIAVLPLTNLSSDPEQEYFSDGMTEALISDLARIGALKVISRASAMTYKGSSKSLPLIARELGVRTIVHGSVLRAGDRVRIGAQLIDAASDTHLWAESFDRELTDVLALQGELAQAIVRQVKIRLTPQEHARLAGKPQIDPAAHDAYLRGRYHLNRATPAEINTAIRHFQDAVGVDPTYALAYAGLANAYNYLGWLGAGAPRDVFPKAKDAATKALEIDDTLAEAHAVLGYTATFYDWDWATAERELTRAVALNPNYAEGFLHLSWYLGSQGRLEEQRSAITRASELDPLSLVIHANMPNHYQWTRDFDQALAEARRALELAPDFPLALLFAGMAHWGKGQYDEAARLFARLVELVGLGFKGYVGYSLAMAGHRDAALTILKELTEASQSVRVPAFQFFLVLLGLERFDEAVSWLERAFKDRDGPFLPYVRQEVMFDPLRDHPRFLALVERLNFA
jgi:TolB-like protein/class 3 adenylate cyclase/Tfp pilus assembly protein PilF